MAKTRTTEANAAAFTKAQLVASQRYVHRRDLIGALLEDGKTYTLNEVDATLIIKGRKTIDQVPALLRKQVEEILADLEVEV